MQEGTKTKSEKSQQAQRESKQMKRLHDKGSDEHSERRPCGAVHIHR